MKRFLGFALVLIFSTALFDSVASAVNVEPKKAVFDFDKPPETKFKIAPNLTFGVKIEIEYQFEGNFNLDSGAPDDLSILTPSVSFAFDYAPTEKMSLFLNIKPSHTFYDDEERKKKNDETIELKQLNIAFNEYLEGLSLKVGRQRFVDKRKWLYDDELDGVRLFYAYSNFALDASVTVKNNKDLLKDNDDKDEDTTNYVLIGMYSPRENMELSAYVFARNDRSSAQDDPFFLGMSFIGETDRLNYWLEASHVRGKTGPKEIRGFGIDLGGTYIFKDIDYKPSMTFGYAMGSGDSDPKDNIDKNFRQTGLQDNSAKFNGVAKLKYYGEMFDPELSNMQILTLGAGIRPTKDSSLDLIYHSYMQHKASDEISDSELDSDPDGLDKALGSEIDLIAGYKAEPHWKCSITIGYFIRGDAFPKDSDNAFFSEINVRYDF